MLGVDLPNDRLDQGTASHPAADRGDDAADLSLVAGGPKYYRDRCDGRLYLASWLQFARLRVDLELHDGVALLVGDV